MSLIVTVDSQALSTVLDKLYQLTSDMAPVMGAIGMEMENRIRGRFETQSDPLGQAWLPWQPATVKSYPEDGHKRLLDRLGDMLGSLNHSYDARSATIGFGDPKAAYHEWGTKHMPRRGLMFADPDNGTLAPDDERALVDIVELVFSQEIGSF